MKWRRSVLIVGMAGAQLVTTGCIESSPRPQEAAISTSQSTELAAVPKVRVGERSSGSTDALHDVVGAFVLSDGRLVIADGSRRQIIFYDLDGLQLSAVGGEGDGPGEFRRVEAVARLRDDSIAVWDSQLDRLTILSDQGELSRTESLPAARGAARTRFLSDGRLVLEHAPSGYESIEDQGLLGGETTLVVLDPEGGGAVEIGPVPATELFVYNRSVLLRAFGDRLMVAIHGNSVLVGSGKGPVFRYAVDGEREDTVWTPPPRRALTDAAMARYREKRLAEVSIGQRPALREALQSMPWGETLPAYSDLSVDRLGRVWLRVYALELGEPDQWLIVEDHQISRVVLPEGSEWLDAGQDYVLLLEQDALDVEHVSLYELAPSGA